MGMYRVLRPVAVRKADGDSAVLHTTYGEEIEIAERGNDTDALVAGGFVEAVVQESDPEPHEPADPPTDPEAPKANRKSKSSKSVQNGDGDAGQPNSDAAGVPSE